MRLRDNLRMPGHATVETGPSGADNSASEAHRINNVYSDNLAWCDENRCPC